MRTEKNRGRLIFPTKYPRKQQKQKTHMCIGKDLLDDGEPYNQQHQHRHQATLQPGEAVRRTMGIMGPAWGEEWMKWASKSK